MKADSTRYWRLFARAGGGPQLLYTPQHKFASRGSAARFGSRDAAERRGRWMIARFPVLRGFAVWAA